MNSFSFFFAKILESRINWRKQNQKSIGFGIDNISIVSNRDKIKKLKLLDHSNLMLFFGL